MNYILLAIPLFAILILIEFIVDHYRKTGYYRINDSISSINAGIISRIGDIFRKLIPLVVYVYLEKNFALFDLKYSIGLWIFAFVLYDLCYYFKHRYSHEINIFWASHVVHHSSEEYNLTTALRQSSGNLINWVFYMPMALIGIDPVMLVTVGSLNLLYQFWVHTRHIPKLGFYEWIFVTPSNHRVHHATNERYVDKNYGGVFIIWDRLFNTFTEESEDEPCNYGIRKPIKSWNPIWVNLHFYTQLVRDAWYTKRWQDKFTIWFRPTGWRPADMEVKFPLAKFDSKTFKKFDNKIPTFTSYYSLIQHLFIIVGGFLYLQNINELNTVQQLLGGSLIILSCFSVGMILEGRKWAIILEYIRYTFLIIIAYQQAMPEFFITVSMVIAVISCITAYFVEPVLSSKVSSL
jgi:sterol desaturase/sphingolipid hydroxylase (fatty acid hydroxylase superfamily)